jgi:signal transduction histidine kinase
VTAATALLAGALGVAASLREDPSPLMARGAGICAVAAGLLAFAAARAARRQARHGHYAHRLAVRARRSVREKHAVLAKTSLEIRAPLTAILGFSEALVAEAGEDGPARRHARAIHASAESLRQVIDGVLDFSHTEAGLIQLHLEPTDLGQLGEMVRASFARAAAAKGLGLEFSVRPAAPPLLLLDARRTRQVLVNLVSNAIKFTVRGEVRVRAWWEPNGVHPSRGLLLFEVRDTGVGIARPRQERIFSPFAGGAAAGGGLGLSLARRLAERMGGSLALESEVGRGSVFRFVLPEVSVATRAPFRLARAAEPAPAGPLLRWPAVLTALEEAEAELWPVVRASGAISEIRAFAARLAAIARAGACEPLAGYADALHLDAEHYALGRIECRLAEFPDLVRSIAAARPTLAPAANRITFPSACPTK